MSQISNESSGGGSGVIQTIAGDSGSITGANVTIFANQATKNSGSSVAFVNSGTTSTFNVTDSRDSTYVGQGAGNAVGVSTGGNLNTGMGIDVLASVSNTGNSNSGFGVSSLNSLENGDINSSYGAGSLQLLENGSANCTFGYATGQAYTGSESNNILIGPNVLGTLGESGVIRIGDSTTGTPQTTCFIAGIANVTTSNSQMVTIDTTTGQLGSAPAGGSSAFFAYNATPVSNVTGDGTQYTCQFDTIVTNIGSDFASNTYTAPVDGVYSFTAGIYVSGVDVAHNVINIRFVDSGGTLIFPLYANAANLSTGTNILFSGSAIIPLSAGETFIVQLVVSGSTKTVSWQGAAIGGNPPYFSGALIA